MAKMWLYPRGKKLKCRNSDDTWFDNVRKDKPHIYFSNGEWNVVTAGTHWMGSDRVALINSRNSAAYRWMAYENGKLDGSNDELQAMFNRLGLLRPHNHL